MACRYGCLPVVQRLIQSKCNKAATTNVSLFVCNIFCDDILNCCLYMGQLARACDGRKCVCNMIALQVWFSTVCSAFLHLRWQEST